MNKNSESSALTVRLSRFMGARESWIVRASFDELSEQLRQRGASSIVTPLAGTPVTCVDIRACGKKARERAKSLVVDVSAQGMCGCAAVRLGAHVAIISCAEHLCALSVSRDVEDVLPGLVTWASSKAVIEAESLSDVGHVLELIGASWRATSDAAQVVASYLRCHPHVEEVRYPGLRSDPSYAIASRTLERGFGPRVDYRVIGEAEWRHATCDTRDVREQVLTLESEL